MGVILCDLIVVFPGFPGRVCVRRVTKSVVHNSHPKSHLDSTHAAWHKPRATPSKHHVHSTPNPKPINAMATTTQPNGQPVAAFVAETSQTPMIPVSPPSSSTAILAQLTTLRREVAALASQQHQLISQLNDMHNTINDTKTTMHGQFNAVLTELRDIKVPCTPSTHQQASTSNHRRLVAPCRSTPNGSPQVA